MSKKENSLYIAYIIFCINLIEDFIKGYDFQSFEADTKTYAATLHYLQNLADATKFLPDDLKENYPSIPWKKIKGFRNILVHDYLGDIDPNTVWKICSAGLTDLKDCLITELPDWEDYYQI